MQDMIDGMDKRDKGRTRETGGKRETRRDMRERERERETGPTRETMRDRIDRKDMINKLGPERGGKFERKARRRDKMDREGTRETGRNKKDTRWSRKTR
jgi:hypothetical protein